MDYTNWLDVITLIYCDYAPLTKPERDVLLKKVYKALKPNGIFIFDVFTPKAKWWIEGTNSSEWTNHDKGVFLWWITYSFRKKICI